MKRINDAVVGLVVIVIVLALAGALAWVKGSDVGKRQHEVVARFHDVGNARVGNVVVIRGVVGGRIQGIELAPAGWVDVKMKLDPTVQLPPDPVVLLNESSLFGEWQATIVERSALPHDETVRQQIDDGSRGVGVLPGATLPGIGKLTAVRLPATLPASRVASKSRSTTRRRASCAARSAMCPTCRGCWRPPSGRTPPISTPCRISCALPLRH